MTPLIIKKERDIYGGSQSNVTCKACRIRLRGSGIPKLWFRGKKRTCSKTAPLSVRAFQSNQNQPLGLFLHNFIHFLQAFIGLTVLSNLGPCFLPIGNLPLFLPIKEMFKGIC